MANIKEYLKETKGELKHVVWPGKNLTIVYTVLVIVLSIFIAYFLGFFDLIFSMGLNKVI